MNSSMNQKMNPITIWDGFELLAASLALAFVITALVSWGVVSGCGSVMEWLNTASLVEAVSFF